MAEQPDATLEQLRDRLGVDVTGQAISKALRHLLNAVTPSDVRGFFDHCGYTLDA